MVDGYFTATVPLRRRGHPVTRPRAGARELGFFADYRILGVYRSGAVAAETMKEPASCSLRPQIRGM